MWDENFRKYLYQRPETKADMTNKEIKDRLNLVGAELKSLFDALLGNKITSDKTAFIMARSCALDSLCSLYKKGPEHYLEMAFDIGIRKNHDYGDVNILTYGAVGLIVRLNDKLARAKTLMEREARVEDEKLEDTLIDIINYATYGEMLSDGVWQ
jgi:hypothetical protein